LPKGLSLGDWNWVVVLTRILHMSDTHLGNRQFGNEQRQMDFQDAFQEAIDIARGVHPDYDVGPVDAVLHTGDLFDDQRTSNDDIYRCLVTLRELYEDGIPFLAIVGNHEALRGFDFVDLFAEPGYAERLSRDPRRIGDDEDIVIYGIDSVSPHAWDATELSLTPVEGDDPFTLVAMHQLFHPPLDQNPNTLPLEPVLDRFEIKMDAIALGDVHERRSAKVDGVPVWYPGSTERTSREDVANRSVELLTIEPDADTPFERRRLTLDTREFVWETIEFGTDEGFTRVESVVQSVGPVEDAVVYLDLDGETNAVTRQDVIAYLDDQGVCHAKVRDLREHDPVGASIDAIDENLGLDAGIDEALQESGFGDLTRALDDVVRGEDIKDTHVRSEVFDQLESEANSVFDDRLTDRAEEASANEVSQD